MWLERAVPYPMALLSWAGRCQGDKNWVLCFGLVVLHLQCRQPRSGAEGRVGVSHGWRFLRPGRFPASPPAVGALQAAGEGRWHLASWHYGRALELLSKQPSPRTWPFLPRALWARTCLSEEGEGSYLVWPFFWTHFGIEEGKSCWEHPQSGWQEPLPSLPGPRGRH